MLLLIVLLLITWAILMALFTAWTVWFQAYIYTEAVPGIAWRGPAAGSALMAVLALWVFVDYGDPGRYRPLWEFSSSEESPFFPDIRVPIPGGGEELYRLRPGTRGDYRLGGLSSGKPLPARPKAVIVTEGSERVKFEPERDEKGNFQQRTTVAFGRESKEPLRYLDPKGRVMLEDSLGQLMTFRKSWLFGNLFLNFLFFLAAFLALWLILRFQWPHALGQAFVLWIAMLLFVLPPLLTRAEKVAQERATARAG